MIDIVVGGCWGIASKNSVEGWQQKKERILRDPSDFTPPYTRITSVADFDKKAL